MCVHLTLDSVCHIQQLPNVIGNYNLLKSHSVCVCMFVHQVVCLLGSYVLFCKQFNNAVMVTLDSKYTRYVQ